MAGAAGPVGAKKKASADTRGGLNLIVIP
jgi:hypothetical protein